MHKLALTATIAVIAAGCASISDPSISAACIQATEAREDAQAVYEVRSAAATDAYAAWEQAWTAYEAAEADYETADAAFQATREATSAAREEAQAAYKAISDAAWAEASAAINDAYAKLSEESLARHRLTDDLPDDLLEHFDEVRAADDAALAEASAVSAAANETAEAISAAAETDYNAARDASWAEHDVALDIVMKASNVLADAASTADAYAEVSNAANAARDQAETDYVGALQSEMLACV